MNKLVEKFNNEYPVGSIVRWRNTPSGEWNKYEVRGEAYDMHGQAVAFLKGKAGCVSVEPQFLDYDFEKLPEGKSLAGFVSYLGSVGS